jgi:hypothetical protein
MIIKSGTVGGGTSGREEGEGELMEVDMVEAHYIYV